MTLFTSRRSIRRYQPTPIAHEHIEALLNAAIWAPSAHNRQPWRFAVVTATQSKQALAVQMGAQLQADLQRDGVDPKIIAQDVARSHERLTSAPLLIVLCVCMAEMDVYPDPVRAQHEYVMAVQSVAMAGQNILLAAHELGLGACWMCAPLFAPQVVGVALDLPADWHPQGVITVGHPAQTREKTRHPLEKVILWR
jgi:coenzyme F420-0:L-glutamate ligase / coenzyme F420-1:gamma-L-glutamate ligase